MSIYNIRRYGRIFTDSQANVENIKHILNDMGFPVSDSICPDVVTTFAGDFTDVILCEDYLCRFSLIELQEKCMESFIPCGYIFTGPQTGELDKIVLEKTIEASVENFYKTKYWTKEKVLRHYSLSYLIE